MGLADQTDTREGRAKMLALLALLDVLDGRAEMAAIGTEKLGPLDARAGQLRLRFTVFGIESRLLELAHELAAVGSTDELTAIVRSRIGRDDKLRMVARMISTWSEVMQRLLADAEPERKGLPQGVPALPDRGEGRAARCQNHYGAILCELDAGHQGDHVSHQLGSRRVWSTAQAARLLEDE